MVALAVFVAALAFSGVSRADESTQVAPVITRGDDPSAFVGKTVSEVNVVVGTSPFMDAPVPELKALRPGDVLTLDKVRAVLDELTVTGQFADAQAFATRDGHAVKIEITATPRRLVASLRLDLHGATLDRDEILRAADLSDTGEIVGPAIPQIKKRVETAVQKHGYPAPRVTLTTRATDDPSRVLVFLDVFVGAAQPIQKRVFYVVGERPLDFEAVTSRYAVRAYDKADEIALAAADTALETLLHTRGYWTAQVTHDLIPWLGYLTARIRIALGPRTNPVFDGNVHYDRSALEAALGLDDEPDKSTLHLTQKIHDFYVLRGYLDAEVTAALRVGPTGDRNVLAFKIIEHPRVIVTGRTYPCLREAEVKKLTNGGPRKPKEIGDEIDSYLDEELPGSDIFVDPRPSGVDEIIGGDRKPLPQSFRASPVDLDPNTVFAPDTYDDAISHVQELYRSEGFLSALVGPVQVARKKCDPKSAPGACIALPLPEPKADVCPYDAASLPLESPAIEPALTCTPDNVKGNECDPHVLLKIPVKLGPRTTLYDLAFRGVRSITTKKLADVTELSLGEPVNTVKIDAGRRKILEEYKEEGFAFVDVKYTLESSPDHTRARAHFDVTEGDKVIVTHIVVRGNTRTDLDVIMKRIALREGEPYRTSDVRKTQERIATLNVFSSVTVGFDDPFVPDAHKVVIVTVAEKEPQYVSPSAGFSTGEGFRGGLEYGHLNLGGRAIGFNARLVGSFLPTPLILDPVAAENYSNVSVLGRLGFRATAGLTFPEIGLGPLVRGATDGLIVHDLQRDYYITKAALIPNLTWRPIRQVQVALYQTVEYNNVRLFQGQTIQQYLQAQAVAGTFTTDLARQLLVPDGESVAVSERMVFTWDRRDNPFNATKGTYLVSGIEHVDAFPENGAGGAFTATQTESHFLRFTETLGGYVPLPKGLRLAAVLRLGTNVQLTSTSQTYPDRFFFMGGVDSMRGWQQNTFLPQDDADRVFRDRGKPDQVDAKTATSPCLPPSPCQPNPDKYTAFSRPIRGGNLMFNPKVELRIPIRSPFETVIFTDIGNLWIDPLYPIQHGKFPLRASVGTGLRVQTPVGPLAVDYGLNVLKIIAPSEWTYEDPWAFHFAIGLF